MATRSPRMALLNKIDEPKPLSDTYVNERGIVFNVKRVSPFIAQELDRKLRATMPKPPMWFNDDKGREEPNPNDPDYLNALNDYEIDRGNLGVSIYITFGTSIKELPDDVEPPDSPSWADELTRVGIEIAPVGTRERYLQWIRFYAFVTADDLNDIVRTAMGISGAVYEEAVKAAEESFRSQSTGNAVESVPFDEGS